MNETNLKEIWAGIKEHKALAIYASEGLDILDENASGKIVVVVVGDMPNSAVTAGVVTSDIAPLYNNFCSDAGTSLCIRCVDSTLAGRYTKGLIDIWNRDMI